MGAAYIRTARYNIECRRGYGIADPQGILVEQEACLCCNVDVGMPLLDCPVGGTWTMLVFNCPSAFPTDAHEETGRTGKEPKVRLVALVNTVACRGVSNSLQGCCTVTQSLSLHLVCAVCLCRGPGSQLQ
jgi:hypothetical protein